MKTYFSLLLLILLIAFCNSSKAQVHKLTYREAYNFNVGDEIYHTDYNYSNCFSQDNYTYYKDVISNKKISFNNDTFFYTINRTSLFINKLYYFGKPNYFSKTTINQYYTNLDDTIIKLEGVDTANKFITGYHYLDAICNRNVSKLERRGLDYWTDTYCMEGAGCYYGSSGRCSGDGHFNSSQNLNGFKSSIGNCGNINRQLQSTIEFIDTCHRKKDIYKISVGDEYVIERKINGLPTEYIYEKVVSTNYDSVQKKLSFTKEYILYRELENSCGTCKSIPYNENQTILNLDTFLFISNYLFELNNLPSNIYNSRLNGICQIPYEEFSYYYGQPAKGSCGALLAIQKNIKQKFIKGFGYLSEIKFGNSYNPTPWYTVSSFCTVDKTNFKDTIENLIFINNQFYHCGSIPDFFNKKYPHETEKYINLFPNPTISNSEITAYKINSSIMEAVDLYDNKGIFKITLDIPECNLNEVAFKFTTQYLNTGVNFLKFRFKDGHQEIHKIIVY